MGLKTPRCHLRPPDELEKQVDPMAATNEYDLGKQVDPVDASGENKHEKLKSMWTQWLPVPPK
jgi:hypothetical protein